MKPACRNPACGKRCYDLSIRITRSLPYGGITHIRFQGTGCVHPSQPFGAPSGLIYLILQGYLSPCVQYKKFVEQFINYLSVTSYQISNGLSRQVSIIYKSSLKSRDPFCIRGPVRTLQAFYNTMIPAAAGTAAGTFAIHTFLEMLHISSHEILSLAYVCLYSRRKIQLYLFLG